MNQTSKFSVRDICYAGLFAAVIAVMMKKRKLSATVSLHHSIVPVDAN